MNRTRGAVAALAFLFLSTATMSQTAKSPVTTAAPPPPAATADSGAQSQQAFIEAADQVMGEMSKILDLPIREPLKKSFRSKAQIREFLVEEEKEDETPAQNYADDKALEAFGLIPRGFPVDSFMLDVLTDQIEGLYDPKAKEFYIADWISIDDQKPVMAHELTHALEDQSFDIEKWTKAARPNDDAEMARHAVSEGSAMAAMLDYSMRDDYLTVRGLPDVSSKIRAQAIDQTDRDPTLSKAPIYIRDQLLFPYLAGVSFTQQFLKAHTGWSDLKLLFENPPASTQQIMHPDLYLKGVKPVAVSLPDWKAVAPADWKLLEENVLGEFGLDEVLKNYLGEARADALSSAWAGDHYAVFEDQKTKETPLVFRLALDNEQDAGGFYAQYSEALALKYKQQTNVFRQPEYLQFDANGASVFLRCVATTCLTVEGASRETYDNITRAIGWTPAPTPLAANAKPVETTSVRVGTTPVAN